MLNSKADFPLHVKQMLNELRFSRSVVSAVTSKACNTSGVHHLVNPRSVVAPSLSMRYWI